MQSMATPPVVGHCVGDGVNCLTHKKRPQTDWRAADSSVMHDVLLVLPQHCQEQVAAPVCPVLDRGDARGLGTHGQLFWKAAKDCWSWHGGVSIEPQWTVGPVTLQCNNGHLEKNCFFEVLGVMMMMVMMFLSVWQGKIDVFNPILHAINNNSNACLAVNRQGTYLPLWL